MNYAVVSESRHLTFAQIKARILPNQLSSSSFAFTAGKSIPGQAEIELDWKWEKNTHQIVWFGMSYPILILRLALTGENTSIFLLFISNHQNKEKKWVGINVKRKQIKPFMAVDIFWSYLNIHCTRKNKFSNLFQSIFDLNGESLLLDLLHGTLWRKLSNPKVFSRLLSPRTVV